MTGVTFTWATVTAVNPLAIKLDGDSASLGLIPDSLVDPLSLTVGDRVRVEQSLRRVVVHGRSGGDVPAGVVWSAALATAPAGWLLCQGQSLLRSDYPRLFAAIGTVYGAADGTHFSVPDLKGRAPVGRDSAQTEFDTLGETGGEKAHVLTVAEMPSHSHPQNVTAGSGGPASRIDHDADGSGQVYPQGVSTDATGGGGSHNNLQPYIVLNYIIKT